MSEKLKVSKKNSDNLDFLSNKLNLKRNIICRLAIGKSLKKEESISKYKYEDNNGYEFNKYTITANNDLLYYCLVNQHEGRRVSEEKYFSHYLRKHIERGVEIMKYEYERVNSPIDYIVGLSVN